MKNPWEEIPLTDYENHMGLDSVMQLQAMNEMMKGQLEAYPVSDVMILCRKHTALFRLIWRIIGCRIHLTCMCLTVWNRYIRWMKKH